jgi:hypothetical protein
VRNKSVDLAQTYTSEFVNAVPRHAASASRRSSLELRCEPSSSAGGFAAFGASLTLCRQLGQLAAR